MKGRGRPAAVWALVLATATAGSALRALEAPASGSRLILETAHQSETFPAAAAGGVDAVRSRDGRLSGLSLGAKVFPLEELLYIRFPWTPLDGTSLLLHLRGGDDGSRGETELAGSVAGGDESIVEWRCPCLGKAPFKIRLEDVKGLLVLGPAGEPPAGRRMSGGLEVLLRDQMKTVRKDHDVVVLLEKGRIEGILRSLDVTGIHFSSEKLGDITIPYAQARALFLAESAAGQPPGPPAAAKVRLVLRDSSQLGAELVDWSRDSLSLRHRILGDLKVPLGDVLEIAFQSGRASYLSDREPARVREESGPLLQLAFPHRRDSNVLGEPIKLGGTTYRKGLGVHSYSCLEYDLAGGYSRFRATVGLDDSARPDESEAGGAEEGSVVFRVKLDGKTIFEKGASWRDPPTPVDLSVAGGKTLMLEVDYGPPEGGYNLVLDRANWAEARVIR